MIPSLLLSSLHRAAASATTTVRRRPAVVPRASSSSSSSIVPPPIVVGSSSIIIPSYSRCATPAQIARARERIISVSNPRSRRGNMPDSRNFPRYAGLPVTSDSDPPDPRRPTPTTTPGGYTLYPSKTRYDTGVEPSDMPYLHHRPDGDHPRDVVGGRTKFRSPRKRASKLFHALRTEAEVLSMKSKPEVWDVPFRVGDAIELGILDDGGASNANNKRLDHVRGVVLGRINRGLDTSIYLKDVLYGEHVERKIKLHSPMVKTLKVLEEGFVNRGKKKGKRIKRAKLYYLRDRGMEETRVTKVDR